MQLRIPLLIMSEVLSRFIAAFVFYSPLNKILKSTRFALRKNQVKSDALEKCANTNYSTLTSTNRSIIYAYVTEKIIDIIKP